MSFLGVEVSGSVFSGFCFKCLAGHPMVSGHMVLDIRLVTLDVGRFLILVWCSSGKRVL